MYIICMYIYICITIAMIIEIIIIIVMIITLIIWGGRCCERHFYAFLKVHVCKRYQALFFPKPNIVASATKATTVHSQQLSHVLHRYIDT